LFRDKDPVIDHLRTAVQKDGKSYNEIGLRSGVKGATLRNWFHGPTRRPQFATIAAVARSLGNDGVAAVVSAVKRGK
jgi:uncharacterized protein YerC